MRGDVDVVGQVVVLGPAPGGVRVGAHEVRGPLDLFVVDALDGGQAGGDDAETNLCISIAIVLMTLPSSFWSVLPTYPDRMT